MKLARSDLDERAAPYSMRGDMIWILCGFRARDILVKSGVFDCPNCKKRRYCKHRKIQTWLTVFLVPVCPGDVEAEYWQCDDCRRSFRKPYGTPFFPAGGMLRSDIMAELSSGSPIELTIKRLVESGVNLETAAGIVAEMAGDLRSICPQCGLSFLEGIGTCRQCGENTVKGQWKKEPPLNELA
jgi:ribosomal protein L37AE/L43A